MNMTESHVIDGGGENIAAELAQRADMNFADHARRGNSRDKKMARRHQRDVVARIFAAYFFRRSADGFVMSLNSCDEPIFGFRERFALDGTANVAVTETFC